jgi:hypothetical protein
MDTDATASATATAATASATIVTETTAITDSKKRTRDVRDTVETNPIQTQNKQKFTIIMNDCRRASIWEVISNALYIINSNLRMLGNEYDSSFPRAKEIMDNILDCKYTPHDHKTITHNPSEHSKYFYAICDYYGFDIDIYQSYNTNKSAPIRTSTGRAIHNGYIEKSPTHTFRSKRPQYKCKHISLVIIDDHYNLIVSQTKYTPFYNVQKSYNFNLRAYDYFAFDQA